MEKKATVFPVAFFVSLSISMKMRINIEKVIPIDQSYF